MSFKVKKSRKGLVYPGTNYTGPFNSLDRGLPTSQVDRASQIHDWGYHILGKRNKNPYLSYNKFDEDWIKNSGNSLPANIGKSIFKTKKYLTKPIEVSQSERDYAKRMSEEYNIEASRKRPRQATGDERSDALALNNLPDDINTTIQQYTGDTSQSGGIGSSGSGHEVHYKIPINHIGRPRTEYVTTCVTRRFRFVTGTHTPTISTIGEGYTGFTNPSTLVTYHDWVMVPVAHLYWYTNGPDASMLLGLAQYSATIKKFTVDIHHVRMQQIQPLTATQLTSIDAPYFQSFIDHKKILYKMNVSTVNSGTNFYSPNTAPDRNANPAEATDLSKYVHWFNNVGFNCVNTGNFIPYDEYGNCSIPFESMDNCEFHDTGSTIHYEHEFTQDNRQKEQALLHVGGGIPTTINNFVFNLKAGRFREPHTINRMNNFDSATGSRVNDMVDFGPPELLLKMPEVQSGSTAFQITGRMDFLATYQAVVKIENCSTALNTVVPAIEFSSTLNHLIFNSSAYGNTRWARRVDYCTYDGAQNDVVY